MNRILIISSKTNESSELCNNLRRDNISCSIIADLLGGIQEAQEQQFDVIVLDTRFSGMKIDQAIRLLKRCNLSARIIIQTDNNSRSMETKARKESIYYYHLNSFGLQDLIVAIKTALNQQANK